MQQNRHRWRGWRRLWRATLLVLALAVAAAPAFGRASATAAAAGTAEGAVALAVAGLGSSYAGDCAAARSPDDLGRFCSKFVSQQMALRAYLIGRTFSEFSQWVFVQQTEAGWLPVTTIPYDDSISPGRIPWPAV